MATDSATEARPGLRERKKQKTRSTIIEVALDLFAEKGYDETTIAEIAHAAEVSPRTIFAYFPSKEDILFADLTETQERLAQALQQRPEGTTALDALREFIVGLLTPGNKPSLRKRIVACDATLQRSERAYYTPLEQVIAEAIAEDLHAGVGDIRPKIVAAAIIAAFAALSDEDTLPFAVEQATAAIDEVMVFLRGGLDAFTRGTP